MGAGVGKERGWAVNGLWVGLLEPLEVNVSLIGVWSLDPLWLFPQDQEAPIESSGYAPAP